MTDNKKDRSYFSVERRRRKRNVMIIIPIVVVIGASIVFGLFFMSGSSINGNHLVLHNHVRLNVTVGGQPVVVPAHIGMIMIGQSEDPLLYGDHSLDKYGMVGMSPLYTHDTTGLIHVESNTMRNFALGEFLDIWKGLDANGKTVIATLDGKPLSDFRNILLKDGEQVTLDIK